MTPRLSRPALWVSLALLAAFATRAPFAFADRPYHDEPIYALIARSWLEGAVPYRDAWDVKGPGLFALYALAQMMGVDALETLWLLPLVAAFAMALALCAMGEDWFGEMRVGAVAALIFAVYALAQDGARGPAILLAAPFVGWGLLLATRARVASAFGGGLLLGCAVTILQSIAFEAVFACALVLFARAEGWRVKGARLGALALGGAAPALAFAALFHAQGALHDLIEATVVVALARSVDHGVGVLEALMVNAPRAAAPFLPLIVIAAFLFAVRARLDAKTRAGVRILGLWCGFAAAGIVLQRAAYTTYMFALLAPLSLAASVLVTRAWDEARDLIRRALLTLACALTLAYPAYWVALETAWTYSIGVLRETAQIIATRAREPGDGAGLYAVDYEASLHLLTGQRPVSRFLFSMHLHCGFILPDGLSAREEIERIFARAPRFVVRRDEFAYRGCIRKDLSRMIDATLEAHYAPLGVLGRLGEVRLYELRAGEAAALRGRRP